MRASSSERTSRQSSCWKEGKGRKEAEGCAGRYQMWVEGGGIGVRGRFWGGSREKVERMKVKHS